MNYPTQPKTTATCADDVSLYALPGHDRDGAAAMLSQSRLKACSPIRDIQVKYLLQIGYRAGRTAGEADAAFERTDSRFASWEMLCAGAVVGVALTVLLTWLF